MKEMIILKNPYGGFSSMAPKFVPDALERGYSIPDEKDAKYLENILKSDKTAQDKAKAINEYSSK